MSTKARNLSNIDGANVSNPDMNQFTATSLENYASDAAFEADHGPGQTGDIYWNTTSRLVRQYNGTAWQNDKTGYETQNDSTTTGSDQDITPNTFNQVIRFTHGSLASIRSIDPSTDQTQVDFINGQGAQNILIKNEDGTATAANRIVTGTGTDVTLVPGQACRFIYDQVGLRWRLSGSLSATGGMSLTDWSMLTNNLSISASVAANALTIALKDKAGADPTVGSPVLIGFRNSTLTNGTYNVRSVNSALSVVVSSGSTLGQQSTIAYPVYIYAIDNGGTVELAVSTTLYDSGSVVSTTAEGGAGAADSRDVIYSTTARSNVPMQLIGKIISTQATAGTWAAAPTLVTTTMTDVPCSNVWGTPGTVVSVGYVGEAIGSAATGTGGGIYQTTTATNISTVAADLVSISLRKGIYLISGFTKMTAPAGAATNTTWNMTIGGTNVGNTWVQQTIQASAETTIIYPTFPVFITTDGATVAIRASTGAGTATNETNNIFAIRIA